MNGYYIEANIDSNTKFNALKKLLVTFEPEDELTLKYSSEAAIDDTSSRFVIRRNFWKQLLPKIEITELFKNVNPTKDHWLSTGDGVSGVAYTLVVTKRYVCLEFALSTSTSTSSKKLNKRYYHQLYQN